MLGMILSLFLALFVGLITLWITKQHKSLFLCEQIVLGFVLGLSYAVLTLFLQGIIFNTISMVPMYVTASGLFLYSIYLHITTGLYKDVYKHIVARMHENIKTFTGLYIWKKVLLIMIILYSIWKVIMAFGINTSLPTYDEDAVAGWDMKTKIFFEQKSLVLDTKNDEFLGTDLSRYPFVGLVDTYLLLPLHQDDVSGLTNIISPIVYLLSILLLFGIFFRLTDMFFAGIMAYVFVSMPFLFVHGIGSYWNFISGFLLFIIVFYYIDQSIDKKNHAITWSILPIGVLYGVLRNEGMGILVILTIFLLIYSYVKTKKISTMRHYIAVSMPIIAFILITYIVSLYSSTFDPNIGSGGLQTGIGMFGAALENITKPGVFAAPFVQAFYHPDYNLFFVLFVIALLWTVVHYKKLSYSIPYFILSIMLLGVFIVTLYANVDGLGLLSHYAFIRYPLGIIHLLVFVTGYALYHMHQKISSGK